MFLQNLLLQREIHFCSIKEWPYKENLFAAFFFFLNRKSYFRFPFPSWGPPFRTKLPSCNSVQSIWFPTKPMVHFFWLLEKKKLQYQMLKTSANSVSQEILSQKEDEKGGFVPCIILQWLAHYSIRNWKIHINIPTWIYGIFKTN